MPLCTQDSLDSGKINYAASMARPKKFSKRVELFIDDQMLAAIQPYLKGPRDRTQILRAGLSKELAIRQLDLYPELQGLLTANETVDDFCAKAVRRAILLRKAALAEPNTDSADQASSMAGGNKK